jgi:hypothetical protein
MCRKTQTSPAFKPGMNDFMIILRGSHLLAHTWASRPTLKFGFLGVSPMEDASFIA